MPVSKMLVVLQEAAQDKHIDGVFLDLSGIEGDMTQQSRVRCKMEWASISWDSVSEPDMARPATRAMTKINSTTWVSRRPTMVAKTILKNDFIGIFE